MQWSEETCFKSHGTYTAEQVLGFYQNHTLKLSLLKNDRELLYYLAILQIYVKIGECMNVRSWASVVWVCVEHVCKCIWAWKCANLCYIVIWLIVCLSPWVCMWVYVILWMWILSACGYVDGYVYMNSWTCVCVCMYEAVYLTVSVWTWVYLDCCI